MADNSLTDNKLQPHRLSEVPSTWSLSMRLGINEGSGEIRNSGYRVGTPRLTFKKNAGNELLFTGSVPYVYQNNAGDQTITIGDPSFITALQVTSNSTFSVGVTEPAANRSVEPDVVRFFAFYTIGLPNDAFTAILQAGTEIADRYAREGQDDILSFGAAIELTATPIRLDLIHKQVVDGQWWDITQPLDSPLNRTNVTASYEYSVNGDWVSVVNGYIGFQLADKEQLVMGIEVSF